MLRILVKLRQLLYAESFSVLIVGIAFGALLLSALFFIVCGDWHFSTTMSEEKVGQFGDFVGGFIGTVLAFAASLLYLLALKEQRKDVRINQQSLQKQTEEFQNQVSELQQSRQAFQKQLEMMQKQQFESNFYSYFNIYLDVKSNIVGKDTNETSILHKFLGDLSSRLSSTNLLGRNEYQAYMFASQEYCKEIISSGFSLSHYFRTFYRLMTIAVSAPGDSQIEKMKYVKIIRSQLSEEELLVLYYNSHSRYAGQAKQLLYEYNVLKHLSPLHKYEISNRFSFYGSTLLMQIERFYDFISPKIKSFINLVCDSIDEQCQEYLYEPINVAVKLEYIDGVCITLVNCASYQHFSELKNIFKFLLFDLLFNSQMIGGKGKIQNEDGVFPNTEFEQRRYLIDSSIIRKIIIDKDDE